MFKPEKLVRVTIQVPQQFVSAATATLAKFRLLHLVRIDETPLGRLGYLAETVDDLASEYEGLFNQVKSLLEALEVEAAAVLLDETVIPEKEIFRLRERIQEIREEAAPVVDSLRTAEQRLAERKRLKERLSFLPADLDFSRLSGRRFIDWRLGLVPAGGLEKLEESLSGIHHALIDLGTIEQQAAIMVFGLKSDGPVFERALKGAFFERAEMPEGLSGVTGQIREGIESEISGLEEEKRRLSKESHTLRDRFGAELLVLRERLIAGRLILTARRFFGKVDSTYFLSGWLPARLLDSLREELSRVTGGQLVFETVDPEDVREVREGIVNIPILFNNPLLIRPFEKLTGLYGTPQYREVEPTIFFALSFLLMFGMMFGDIGHGGVLFLLGYIIFRRYYRYIDYGIILMECGVSSALFGALYGSLFGLENVFPALWFRPMQNITYFVKLTLLLGVGLVSLGLILNLVNCVRLKDYKALPTAGGLAGTLFYWMLVGLGVKYLVTGQLAPAEVSLFGWVATGLAAIMVLHRPLYRVWGRLTRKRPQGAPSEGILTEIMESIVESLDNLIRYLASTISFVRVAAFALTHAALFLAVFSIADTVATEKGGGFYYWLVIVLGNIVTILLEGLVVSIQTVRLEYYEFFGKFFRGGGEKFRSFDREITG